MARKSLGIILAAWLVATAGLLCNPAQSLAAGNEDNRDYSATPPFITTVAPPLVLIVMGRDHKLYYEAYDDHSDLNGDGILDVGYKPGSINYYGYFDCDKCYTYSTTSSRFEPTSTTTTKTCAGPSDWSGDFLNYLTMSRMDCLRKVLYGGYRSTDSESETVLQGVYIPQDAHSWGKEYTSVAVDGYDIRDYSPLLLPTSGTRHLFAVTTLQTAGNPPVLRTLESSASRIWEWVSKERPVADDSLGTPTDRVVRVKVCDPAMPESNCRVYPGSADEILGDGNDVYKPAGILQRYGETGQMTFGLVTGSYARNTSGGVLRQRIHNFSDEIDTVYGRFKYTYDSSVKGVIKTIDKLRVRGFSYSDWTYSSNCGWITTGPISEGQCRMWGNPIAEMMYEGSRYFAGTTAATGEYTYSSSDTNDDNSLGLPLEGSWDDPYGTAPWCSQPFMLVISDVNPSYDSDQLPGSHFNPGWSGSTLTSQDGTSLNVSGVMDTISTAEGISGSYYVGENGATVGSSCSPKTVTELGEVRGLCPEEPTKQGSYYSAAISYFAHEEDLSARQRDQKVITFAVGLASPLPKIEIPIGAQKVTLVPFGKTVYTDHDLTSETFQPTDTIVDFYVDTIGATYGKFRINYEDVEQGADHDMDVVVIYEYQLLDGSDSPVSDPLLAQRVKIKLTKEYQAAGYNLHLGYIISGTNGKDGTYLEIASKPTHDVLYSLDTPTDRASPGRGSSTRYLSQGVTGDDTVYSRERIFTPGTNPAATLLNNPLWYAAKWGGFMDYNGNHLPDQQEEWDANGDGEPDNYFAVQNPLHLEQQLDETFRAILERASAGTAASVISSTRSGEGAVYQAVFYPRYMNTVSWAGEVHALLVDAYGNMREDTNGNQTLDLASDYIVQFSTTNPGEVLKYRDTNGDGWLTDTEKSGQSPVLTTIDGLTYLWRSTPWLNGISDTNVVLQRTYASTEQKRHIFTFVDADNDMVVDSGEVIDFDNFSAHDATIRPYVHLWNPFNPPTWKSNATRKNQETRAQIDYIRGLDQAKLRSRKYIDTATGTTKTYRLGDVVHSTPTAIGRPAENYDLLYRDESYRSFFTKYRNRRTVVYAGGNDGMFHAFNGGFPIYNPSTRAFQFGTQSQGGSETQFPLGAEMWAYVPYNLLPHLYWLTRMDYQHVYYCDLKPRVFDARVYDPALPDTDEHPKGWATLLVGGMRFGGGRIRTDVDHDGTWAAASDKTLKSAYFILDITNPEAAPRLLAEVSLPELGYTTGSPAVVLVKDKSADTPNNWYLVLGTGPNGMRLKYTGSPSSLSNNWKVIGRASGALGTIASYDLTAKMVTLKDVIGQFSNNENVYRDTNNSGLYDSGDTLLFATDLNSTLTVVDLTHGASSQQAAIYMIDLVQLARYGNLKDQGDTTLILLPPSGPSAPAQRFDTNAFVSDLVAADLDLDYKGDAVYFGTVSGSPGSWAGKLRRIVVSDPDTGVLPATPSTWVKDSTLIDVGKPITAAPAVAMDATKQTWIFFGTGRYLNLGDATDTSQQTYYGIKEPVEDRPSAGTVGLVDIDYNEMTWGTVGTSDLLDVSNVVTFEGGTILCDDGTSEHNLIDCTNISDLNSNGKDDFNDLLLTIRGDATRSPALAPMAGWYLNFPTSKERNVGQAALLGGLLTFTSYVPDSQLCSDEGSGYLWAVYYETGSAFPSKNVVGFGDRSITEGGEVKKEFKKTVSLGKGLATSPNIHTGRETGSKAYVQTSTGAIVIIDQDNPGATKSGRKYWEEE